MLTKLTCKKSNKKVKVFCMINYLNENFRIAQYKPNYFFKLFNNLFLYFIKQIR